MTQLVNRIGKAAMASLGFTGLLASLALLHPSTLHPWNTTKSFSTSPEPTRHLQTYTARVPASKPVFEIDLIASSTNLGEEPDPATCLPSLSPSVFFLFSSSLATEPVTPIIAVKQTCRSGCHDKFRTPDLGGLSLAISAAFQRNFLVSLSRLVVSSDLSHDSTYSPIIILEARLGLACFCHVR